MPGFCIAGDLYSKPRKSLCDRIPLTFVTASRCLHSLCSVDMTAFAAFATRFCLRHCVFLCKGTKAQEFCKAEFLDSLPVSALELGTLFPNSAQAEFGSFGLGRLERNGFLCAKAPLDPRTLFLFFAPAVWGFGSGPWVRLGIPGAKAANETGGLCPYSALPNRDTFCLRLDFY